MNKKANKIIFGTLALGAAAAGTIMLKELIGFYKEINDDEFSEALAQELKEGFEELEGKI